MSKITIENKKGIITITNRLSYPETVNERIYNAIASGMFEGILPVSINAKRKETRIECVVKEMIPLTQYFCGITTKKMFLDFVYEIVSLIKYCEKNMLNANNLDLERDKIFVDPQTKRIKCIYWPVVNNQRSNPPHLFLKQLPYDLNFGSYDNKEFISSYKAFFSGLNPFSINNFERLIWKLAGKESTDSHNTLADTLSGALDRNGKAASREVRVDRKANIEYDPFADQGEPAWMPKAEPVNAANTNCVACTSCGAVNPAGSNFCFGCGMQLMAYTPLAEETPWKNTVVDDGLDIFSNVNDGTTVAGYNMPEATVPPILTRLKTNEAYLVDKPVFVIGTDSSGCDLYVYDNGYISRKHAYIATRNGRYYLVDRNSTNKTYVEGEMIAPEQEIEIFSGTQIRFANEDFVFSIVSQYQNYLADINAFTW